MAGLGRRHRFMDYQPTLASYQSTTLQSFPVKRLTLFSPIGLLILLVVYLLLHLPSLTILPVFADEAIYIRWAQLIIDDWRRYLFFPMNDGKTPLFIWLLVPFQFLFSDQLYV